MSQLIHMNKKSIIIIISSIIVVATAIAMIAKKQQSVTSIDGELQDLQEVVNSLPQQDTPIVPQVKVVSEVKPAVPTETVQTVQEHAEYTAAQVAQHNSASSCYTIVNGVVYDLTDWISQHPGGSRAIIRMCGVDGTAEFMDQHGGQGRPEAELANYKIGILK
jgi:cytochrome b involved in lipid metabolism